MTTNPLLDSPLKPPPPPSELEELMSRDPLGLSAQDIDKLIAMQRANRARRESGKGKGKSQLQDGSSLNLVEAMKESLASMKASPKPAAAPALAPTLASAPRPSFRRI